MNFKLWLEEWTKFDRQRYLPFMRGEPLYQYAKPFIKDDIKDFGLEDSAYTPDKLFHVTTNLSAIKASGILKSRSQLGNTTFGLGGGPNNMSPRAISLTYNYGRALEIYESFRFVADIVSNKTTAYEIYVYASSANNINYDDDELSNTDEVLNQYVPKKYIVNGDDEKIKLILNKKITTPREKYEFLQELESAVIADNKTDYSDYAEFEPVIGFTTDFHYVQNLKRHNIAIIQVAIRKDASVEHYQPEAEIRVDPADVVIVRYLQP